MDQVISGLEAGSWYALMALAIVVVFKATDIPNFAQAQIGLVAAYVATSIIGGSVSNLTYFGAIAAGLAVGFVIGAVLMVVFFLPIADRGHGPTLLMAFGLLLGLNEFARFTWKGESRALHNPWPGGVEVLGAQVAWTQVVTIGLGFVIVLALTAFFRSNLGIQMRALAEDRYTPRLLGVKRVRVFVVAWGVAGALSALALMLQSQATLLVITSGDALILKGFVAAVVGGFFSIPGAFVGGLTIGVLENLAGGYIGTASKAAVALLAVVVILMWRPRGLLSPPQAREV